MYQADKKIVSELNKIDLDGCLPRIFFGMIILLFVLLAISYLIAWFQGVPWIKE